ncbi:MAG: 23S rRNA (adenine(2030)-N(6))-methyltransferase RlmJ, partial [Pseudomonadota bacterium]
LTLRRGFWGFWLGLLSTAAFYGAYAWIVTAAVAVTITLGEMTMYLLVFKQGQSAVAASLLDAGDRLILHERHPAEHAALMAARQRLDARGRGRDGPQVRVERTDGHEALRRIAPGKRPGLALVDPSYEVKDEYGWVAETVITARARWREGIVMAWYPLLPAGRHEAMAEAVVDTLGPVAIGGACLRHEVHLVDRPARGMVGSGLLIAGIGAAQVATLEAAWAACARVFHAPPA